MSKQTIDELVEEASEPVDDTALAKLPRSDLGNGRRFFARHGRDVRFTQRIGTFVWDGKRWLRDDGEVAVRTKAQATADAILADELAAFDEANAHLDEKKREARKEAFERFALGSTNTARISNMVTEAKPMLQHAFEAWNDRGELFNAPNGTLMLDGTYEGGGESGEPLRVKRRAHRREDYITCIGGVDYDPTADCPLFKETLAKVQPDASMRAFLQRYFGSSLIDSSKDQAILINHGGGSNGKSTIIDAICNALGSYAVTTDVSVLLHSDAKATSGGPQPSLIKLANGARLVRAAEPELGLRLSESLIKQLTGGEPMEARDMFEKPIEFRPRFKIVLSCNSRPPIRGGDYGIWRRILLCPWAVQIAKEDRDETLPERLKAEAAGILNWLLEGLLDWYSEGGLKPPADVLQATEEYRQDSDAVGRFLNEWCVMGDREARTEIKELHHAFEAWCAAEEVKPLTLNFFSRRLTDRGIEHFKSDGASYRRGVALTEGAAKAAAERKQRKADIEADREWRLHKRGGGGSGPPPAGEGLD